MAEATENKVRGRLLFLLEGHAARVVFYDGFIKFRPATYTENGGGVGGGGLNQLRRKYIFSLRASSEKIMVPFKKLTSQPAGGLSSLGKL